MDKTLTWLIRPPRYQIIQGEIWEDGENVGGRGEEGGGMMDKSEIEG